MSLAISIDQKWVRNCTFNKSFFIFNNNFSRKYKQIQKNDEKNGQNFEKFWPINVP